MAYWLLLLLSAMNYILGCCDVACCWLAISHCPEITGSCYFSWMKIWAGFEKQHQHMEKLNFSHCNDDNIQKYYLCDQILGCRNDVKKIISCANKIDSILTLSSFICVPFLPSFFWFKEFCSRHLIDQIVIN